ncbi:MAG: hypothetical protein PHV34_14215 [Verrucomicrobiae bacterium]|nr:hypothetical protein [Verrucomicrobiae bacterium]
MNEMPEPSNSQDTHPTNQRFVSHLSRLLVISLPLILIGLAMVNRIEAKQYRAYSGQPGGEEANPGNPRTMTTYWVIVDTNKVDSSTEVSFDSQSYAYTQNANGGDAIKGIQIPNGSSTNIIVYVGDSFTLSTVTAYVNFYAEWPYSINAIGPNDNTVITLSLKLSKSSDGISYDSEKQLGSIFVPWTIGDKITGFAAPIDHVNNQNIFFAFQASSMSAKYIPNNTDLWADTNTTGTYSPAEDITAAYSGKDAKGYWRITLANNTGSANVWFKSIGFQMTSIQTNAVMTVKGKTKDLRPRRQTEGSVPSGKQSRQESER